jgi:hypothetical protein
MEMTMATKLDAQNARAREALILPYKRKIASLAIRADFFKDEGKKGDVAERAREAIAEIDAQVEDLAAIKFPAETKAAVAQAEVDKMKASYADIRKTFVALAA